MIRYYCQYSFGGFRTFRIYGHGNEALADQEVDSEKNQGFPQQACLYFNYGGAKLIYRVLDNGELDIILREIPGIEKDTDGRPINCALQIIGDADDMIKMNNIFLSIVNDLDAFQLMFVSGFSLRNGIHYNGDILRNFVEKFDSLTLNAHNTVLEKLSYRKGPVFVFVPSSPLFITDGKLAAKVIRDLELGGNKKERETTLINTISYSDILGLKGKIVGESPYVINVSDSAIQENEIDINSDSEYSSLEREEANEINGAIATKPEIRESCEHNGEITKCNKCEELERKIQEQEDIYASIKLHVINLERKEKLLRKIIIYLSAGLIAFASAFFIALCVK